MEPNQESNEQVNNVKQEHINGDTGQNSETMESTKPSNDVVFQDVPAKKSSKTGIILGFVLLALIAAGGVGFGVWAMMDGNTQREQLNEQIAALKEQNDRLSEQISDDPKNDDNSESEQDSANDDNKEPIDEENRNDSANTVAIDEWGVSVLFPEDFDVINYEYKSIENEVYCSSYISITSVEKNGELIDSGELGGLASILKCSGLFPYGHLIYDDGDNQYYYAFPNGLSVYDPQPVQDVADELKNHFRSEKTFIIKP